MNAEGVSCRVCGNQLAAASDEELCVGCANEAAGRCRWCGHCPPTSGSELCADCEAAGDIALNTGSFEAAQPTIDWWRQYCRAPEQPPEQ